MFEPFLVTLNDRHGRHIYVLRQGDTLTFRGDVAHGPDRLEKVPIRLLSIIIYCDEVERE